jgi:hypothetical protein
MLKRLAELKKIKEAEFAEKKRIERDEKERLKAIELAAQKPNRKH